MSDAVTVTRTARRPHRCGCGGLIARGERHLLHTLFPHSDLGNREFWTTRECARCAGRHGRAHLLAPTSAPDEVSERRTP